MNQEVVLYIGTITMVFLAMAFTGLVVWATVAIKDFKKFSRDRDKHYSELINAMESMIKKEFLQVIKSIKNYKN